jgi:ATP-binding cassette subfamily B protein
MKKILPRLLKSARSFMVAGAIAVTCAAATAAADLAVPLVLRRVVQALRLGEPRALLALAGGLVALYLARGVISGLGHWFAHVVGYGMLAKMRVAIYEHIQKLSQRYFQRRATGDLMQHATSDVTKIEVLFAHTLQEIFVNTLILAGVSAILFALNWKLALAAMLPVPILIVLLRLFGRQIRGAYRAVHQKLADIGSRLQDNLSGIRVIQSFNREAYEKERFDRESEQHYVAAMSAIRRLSVLMPAIEIAGSIGTALVLGVGAWLILQKHALPLEDFVTFFFCMGLFYRPILMAVGILDRFHDSMAAAERIFSLLDTAPDVVDAPNAVVFPHNLRGRIEFRNVSFEYDPEIPVLRDVSFAIEPNKILALVGPTGAGKSTVIHLLPRFYDVTSGAILIDGHDVRQLQLAYLRRQMSLVTQDVFLFNGTVRENILYSCPSATDEQVEAASRAARAHEFIVKLPQGYDTIVGERGARLSGGEKQRIAIARAVLRNAPILILDEATSAMDVETEAQIAAALRDLMKNRTTIMIAHRLSTVKRANQILFLDKGRVMERGDHDELMAKRGHYWRMWSAAEREEVFA